MDPPNSFRVSLTPSNAGPVFLSSYLVFTLLFNALSANPPKGIFFTCFRNPVGSRPVLDKPPTESPQFESLPPVISLAYTLYCDSTRLIICRAFVISGPMVRSIDPSSHAGLCKLREALEAVPLPISNLGNRPGDLFQLKSRSPRTPMPAGNKAASRYSGLYMLRSPPLEPFPLFFFNFSLIVTSRVPPKQCLYWLPVSFRFTVSPFSEQPNFNPFPPV